MNINDIAKMAGVSASTVSKIVNNKDGSISSETRERVLKIVKEYHYAPYSQKINASQKTYTFGVLLSSSISMDSTLDGIIKTAQKNGYRVLVFNAYDDADQELKNISAVSNNQVDGVIWEPISQASVKRIALFKERDIPLITIGAFGGDHSLLIPYQQAAYQITQELIDHRHTRIACLLSEGRRTDAFLEGYRECLFDNNLTYEEDLVYTDLDDSLLHRINSHYITGVISSHHSKAIEFYGVLRDLAIKVPEDVSLISLKNDNAESRATFALNEISTLTVRNSDFGAYICNKMVTQLETKKTVKTAFSQEFKLDNETTVAIPYQFNKPKVTVIGSINMDTYLRVPKLPESGKTVTVTASTTVPGGHGINQAIGVAQLEQPVTLIGNIGSDLESDTIYKELEHYDINVRGVNRINHIDTGHAIIYVGKDGNSTVSVLPGANSLVTPEYLTANASLFKNSGYCLIQSELPLETIERACTLAHKYGATTIFKPSTRSKIPVQHLSGVDILVLDRQELALLAPEAGELKDQAEFLLNAGISKVIVTLGGEGCYLATADTERVFPAIDFPKIDTTAATDAFISALATYLLAGYTLEEAIRVANYAAGFCISREGAAASLIDRRGLESYIHQTEPGLLDSL